MNSFKKILKSKQFSNKACRVTNKSNIKKHFNCFVNAGKDWTKTIKHLHNHKQFWCNQWRKKFYFKWLVALWERKSMDWELNIVTIWYPNSTTETAKQSFSRLFAWFEVTDWMTPHKRRENSRNGFRRHSILNFCLINLCKNIKDRRIKTNHRFKFFLIIVHPKNSRVPMITNLLAQNNKIQNKAQDIQIYQMECLKATKINPPVKTLSNINALKNLRQTHLKIQINLRAKTNNSCNNRNFTTKESIITNTMNPQKL